MGAHTARGEWILFLDADCRPAPGLIDAYFSEPIPERVGAVAGEVIGVAESPSLAARYGAARGFLSQREHLAHPYLPRAVAANLLVRRAAFEQVGGFYEGLRAAEDTDFTWRLQQRGLAAAAAPCGLGRPPPPRDLQGASPSVAGIRRGARMACAPLRRLRA